VDHTLRLIQHNWVVLAYNFNVVILVLIIGESCICAFLLILLLQFYPFITVSHATQTCCSEVEDGLEFFDEEFYATCCPSCRSCGVMKSFAVLFR
jgi:hypothetical protein